MKDLLDKGAVIQRDMETYEVFVRVDKANNNDNRGVRDNGVYLGNGTWSRYGLCGNGDRFERVEVSEYKTRMRVAVQESDNEVGRKR